MVITTAASEEGQVDYGEGRWCAIPRRVITSKGLYEHAIETKVAQLAGLVGRPGDF